MFSEGMVNFFFQKSHSPCRKKRIFEKTKKTTKNNKKQMARLLTYDGQVIDPAAYIYMALPRNSALMTISASHLSCIDHGTLLVRVPMAML